MRARSQRRLLGPVLPGLLLFRFDAPLFFANADHFERRVQQVIDEAPDRVHRVIIAAEPITDIDTSAAAMLESLIGNLEGRGIELVFAELKGPVKDHLVQYGIYERLGTDCFPPTLNSAVKSYAAERDLDWTD